MAEAQSWYSLGAVPPFDLEEARVQTHYAVQWLGRVARAALPARADESHTNLGWEPAINGLATHPIPTREGPIRLGLSFTAGGLVLMAGDEAIAMLPLDAVTDDEVRDSLGARATRLGVDPARLLDPLPYELPDHPLAEGGVYGFGLHSEAIRELGRWFVNGTLLLERLVQTRSRIQPGPTRPRVWPHHFDLGMLIVLADGDPETVPTVGLGLSPGDDLFAEPYFYITPYPQPGWGVDLPKLPAPAHWHTGSHTGIVLSGSEVVRASDPHHMAQKVIDHGVDVCLALIDR